MAITPKISPRILNSIASLYNDTNRIFMEYIDNAIDSADQKWLNEKANKYEKPIEIIVQFSGIRASERKVTFTDNCFGITNFRKVVESIGSSDKKAQGFTNGEFGFGIYSFMAACADLEIISKESGQEALRLELNRELFDKQNVEDVRIANPHIVARFPYQSGTIIHLSNFDSEARKGIDVAALIEEVEKHFELILHRENLLIKVIDFDGIEHVCKPFDYDAFKGEVYEDHITHLHVESGGRYRKTMIIRLDKQPIKVFLKMTKGVSLNKPPVFIAKGRRICEIKDVRSFKSQHKSDIWGHTSVTGYIDVQDFLKPTIARNDFRRSTKEQRALYKHLYELEDLITEYVQRANDQSDEKHYHQLEDALNQALAKLARVDAMNFRTIYIKGGETNLVEGSTGLEIDENNGEKDIVGEGSSMTGAGIGENEGGGAGPVEQGSDMPGGPNEGDEAKSEAQFADSKFKGIERKKSGFNIRIVDVEPQIDGETDKPLRSDLVGNEIVVYKKHPDFQSRLKHTRQGESKISERLLAYIAGEITIHYKDELYKKQQEGQPEYNKKMFVSMAEFIYQLESTLSSLAGKNLSELS